MKADLVVKKGTIVTPEATLKGGVAIHERGQGQVVYRALFPRRASAARDLGSQAQRPARNSRRPEAA